MKFNTLIPAALFAAACAFSYSAQAEEVTTTKTETVRASDGTVVKEKVEHKQEQRDGNWFTDFWVHKVGGTIGNGLKKGTHKVDRAFNDIGGKDNDEPKKTTEVKTETKTEVHTEPAPVK